MPKRNKILILEHDDFLREIIGNLLHKKGGYILNGSCITDGLENAKKHHITTVILGTSCKEYKGKETLHYINKTLNQSTPIEFFVINHTGKKLGYLPADRQMKIENLSIQKILNAIEI